MFGADIAGESVAIRPEIVMLSKQPLGRTETRLTAKGKIVQHISHGSLIRFGVDFDGLLLNADVVYESGMDFAEGETVYAAVKKELVIGL